MTRTKPATDHAMWSRVRDEPFPLGDVSGPGRGAGSVSEEIARRIGGLVRTGALAPGTRLPSERDLAAALSTSRPMVSQAVRILVVQGLVESRHGAGAFVAALSHDRGPGSIDLSLEVDDASIGQLEELRLWLETAGAAEAATRVDAATVADLEQALRELRERAGDVAAWMSADTRFHATVVRAGGNPFLASMFERIHAAVIGYEHRAWIESSTTPAWLDADAADDLAAVHEPILRALRDGDPAAARAAVLRHHEVMTQHLRSSRAPGD